MSVPQKIGRYEVIDELGRGAMGAVYRAKDPAVGRIVALKTIISAALASEQGSEFRERFFREARAAGHLTHPGIVPVFDVGEHEGSPFLVMEYVNGWTLASAAERGERLGLDRMCEIGQKIAEALGYAHQRGVVHRDIKPANILVTSRETYGEERPKITDFGIAKLTEGEATMTGKMLGTPAFMPPEQFTGAPVDGRADIFSLGVVLYWLATGEQPFPGEGLTAVLYKVVHTEPIPPRKLNPALPARFESIVLKCMEKDPSARYQTAEELARDLADLRAGKTAATPPVAAAKAFSPMSDTDATVVATVRPVAQLVGDTPTLVAAPVAAAPGATPAVKRKSPVIPITVAAAVLLAGGGWFAVHSRQKAAPQPPPAAAAAPATPVPIAPPTTADSTIPAAPTPASPPVPSTPGSGPATKPTPAAAKPAPGKPEAPVSPKQQPASAAARPGTLAVADSGKNPGSSLAAFARNAAAKVANAINPKSDPAAEPKSTPSSAATLGFDPMTLDPKLNAKLKIDAEGMPKGLEFTVEMNGKAYSRNTHGADTESFLPPGVHAFRVTAKSGAVAKTSNVINTEFKAKKRYTLKVELHLQGKPASDGMPNGLYPDSEIVISLK